MTVDVDYGDFRDDGALAIDRLDGAKTMGEAAFVMTSGAGVTLLFNDLFMNQAHMPGFTGMVYRWMGASGGPRVHPMFRWRANKRRLREHLERLADLPELVRIVLGHGAVIEDDPRGVLRAAAAKL